MASLGHNELMFIIGSDSDCDLEVLVGPQQDFIIIMLASIGNMHDIQRCYKLRYMTSLLVGIKIIVSRYDTPHFP